MNTPSPSHMNTYNSESTGPNFAHVALKILEKLIEFVY